MIICDISSLISMILVLILGLMHFERGFRKISMRGCTTAQPIHAFSLLIYLALLLAFWQFIALSVFSSTASRELLRGTLLIVLVFAQFFLFYVAAFAARGVARRQSGFYAMSIAISLPFLYISFLISWLGRAGQ